MRDWYHNVVLNIAISSFQICAVISQLSCKKYAKFYFKLTFKREGQNISQDSVPTVKIYFVIFFGKLQNFAYNQEHVNLCVCVYYFRSPSSYLSEIKNITKKFIYRFLIFAIEWRRCLTFTYFSGSNISHVNISQTVRASAQVRRSAFIDLDICYLTAPL